MNASGKPILLVAAMLVAAVLVADAQSQDEPADLPVQGGPAPVAQVISDRQRRMVDRSVDRALQWMAARQQRDGSFPATADAQPGVTALCVQAFLTRGHLPGSGPYGEAISSAVDYILDTQKPSGVIALQVPSDPNPARFLLSSRTAMYNHSIAGVALCEVYGMSDAAASERIRTAIEKALAFTRRKQIAHKRHPGDKGGWRYLRQGEEPEDADLSVTSWQLMFLRAAKNAGFHVPSEQIDEAMAYVVRRFDRSVGTFEYVRNSSQGAAKRRAMRTTRHTRAMAGSGILSLALGGMHDTAMARSAGQWILRNNFDRYNQGPGGDRYHYGAYYCSQAMFQLGGEYWRQFYPRLVRVLVANQNRDGSWGPESGSTHWGVAYSTAMAVQALTVPYQLAPIYQR